MVTVTDNDLPDLVAVESLTIVEGGTGSFEVVLATQPSAVVTVTIGSGDTGAVTVTDTSFVFTTGDWGTAQSVMVSGVKTPTLTAKRLMCHCRPGRPTPNMRG